MSEAHVYTIVVLVILTGLAWLGVMLYTWRHASYRGWPRPLRWPYLALVALLSVIGFFGLAHAWSEVWGWPATIWLLGAPIATGFLQGLLPHVMPGLR